MTEVALHHNQQLRPSKPFISKPLKDSDSTASISSLESELSTEPSPVIAVKHQKVTSGEGKEGRETESQIERRIGRVAGEISEQTCRRQSICISPKPNLAVIAALQAGPGSDPEKRSYRINSNSQSSYPSVCGVSPRQRNSSSSSSGGAKNTSAQKKTYGGVGQAQIIRPAPLKQFCLPPGGRKDTVSVKVVPTYPTTERKSPQTQSKPETTVPGKQQKQKKQQFPEEGEHRHQQRNLQNQKQRKVDSIRQKQQQQKEKTRKKHDAQCAFPVRTDQQLRGRASYPMSPSDRNNTQQLSSHVQIMAQTQHDHSAAPYHHQQQRSRVKANSTATTSGGDIQPNKRMHMHVEGVGSVNGTDLDSTAPPSPLFERLVSEEVQELKSYARIIESQNRRISDLERIHDDLEARLEMETKERMNLEERLEEEKRKWAASRAALEKERDDWKNHAQSERVKNERLLDQVNRKDKEIHRMIQRKYDAATKNAHLKEHSHGHGRDRTRSESSVRNETARLQPTNNSSKKKSFNGKLHSGPHDILKQGGTGGAVRQRNVTNSLLDFFGM